MKEKIAGRGGRRESVQDRKAVMAVTTLIVFLLVVPLLAPVQQPEANVNSPAAGNGEELVRTLCASCHSLERAVPGGRTREEWERTVQDMVSRGAQILSADAETIINYLAEQYPVGAAPLQEMRLLVWVDRRGNVEPLAAPPRSYNRPSLSPDGQRVAVEVLLDKAGIWIYDIPTGELRRLTYEGINRFALWSPDGQRVLFGSVRDHGTTESKQSPRNHYHVYWKQADGSGEAERLTDGELNHGPQMWTPDGKTLSISENHPETGRDIWMLPFEGERKPWPFLRTPHQEGGVVFSADGRWLAHTSKETGRYEIVIRGFPTAQPMRRVSTDGGVEVVWPRDSKELFYRNGNRRMAVEVTTRPTLRIGTPRVMFEGDFVHSPGSRANWDSTRDGRRFLLLKKVQ